MTVTTRFPAVGAASPVDGEVGANTNPQAWTAKQGAASGTVADSTAITIESTILTNVTADWRQMFRVILLFDFSDLADSDSKDSATMELVANSKTNQLGAAGEISMVTSNPASTSSVATGDYSTLGTLKQATNRVIGTGGAGIVVDVVTPVYSAFTLNGDGLTSISLTAITKFGLRVEADRGNLEPTFVSDEAQRVIWDSADEVRAVESRPKLVLTHTAEPSATQFAGVRSVFGSQQPVLIATEVVAY